jgi:hypothetical protein
MKREDLIQILEGDIDHIDHVDMYDENMCSPEVEVHPKHVKRMLLDFISDKLSAQQLQKWAEFISYRCDYSSINFMELEDEDYYEVMWDVINCLSTPELDGEITKESVKGYLLELQKYTE